MSKMPGRLLRLRSYGNKDKDSQGPVPDGPVSPNELRRDRNIQDGLSPDRMDVLKKHGLSGLGGRSKSKDQQRTPSRDQRMPSISHARGNSSPAPKPTKPVNKLNIKIESPPNVFYGNPTQSTGALMSGLLKITVVEPGSTLETFDMELFASVTARKPVSANCSDCAVQRSSLFSWKFLTQSKPLEIDEHDFPFSWLLPGHLPATTPGVLGHLEYYLEAKAVITRSGQEPETLNLHHPIIVKRALGPLPDKNSLRIFPPTNLTAHVLLAPVIHPIGDFNVLMKLNGLTDTQRDVITRWSLRKMTWKIEEHEKMVSPACTKHSAKLGGEGKGIQHEDTRTLGEEELKTGWKYNWSEGALELEFAARPLGAPLPLCDIESPTGLSINHHLVIELVVAEEWAPVKKPDALTPTGAARVLRMQFVLMITERSGMGISWEDEQPPVYEDVPASPPVYATDDLRKMKQPVLPSPAFFTPSGSPNIVPVGLGTSRVREPSALRFASTREYTGPPLDQDVLEEEVERLDLRDGDGAGPSAAHIADHIGEHARPSARSRRRLDVDDFMSEATDSRGAPPPLRDGD